MISYFLSKFLPTHCCKSNSDGETVNELFICDFVGLKVVTFNNTMLLKPPNSQNTFTDIHCVALQSRTVLTPPALHQKLACCAL